MPKRKATTYVRKGPANKKRKLNVIKISKAPKANRGWANTQVMARVEKKYFDKTAQNYIGPLGMLSNGFSPLAPFCLNTLGSGSTVIGRVGRKCNFTSLLFNYKIHQYCVNTFQPQTLRIMLVIDYQNNNSQTNKEDILQWTTDLTGTGGQPGNSLAEALNIISPLNLNNRERFKVIYDKRHYMSTPNSIIDGTTTKFRTAMFKSKYKALNLETTYSADDATGTALNIATGAIYFLAFSDLKDPVPSSNNCFYIDWYSRLRYFDA